MAEDLVPLPPVERLSPRVTRILGMNPSKFTLQGTNTYLVGTGASRVLIDTGEGLPEYLPHLKAALQLPEGGPVSVSVVVITHHHHDHIGGVDDVHGLSADTPLRLAKFLEEGDEEFGGSPPQKFEPLRDGDVIKVEGATLRVIHTPGHTDDHLCLYLEEDKAVFSADCILGQGTAVFQNLKLYLNSLEKLLPFQPEKIYPGHGPVIQNGEAKIKEYISHRLAREVQIVEFMRSQGAFPRTAMEMVKKIYASYPEALHEPAKGSVLLHLGKLEEDGRVLRIPGKTADDDDTFILQEVSKI